MKKFIILSVALVLALCLGVFGAMKISAEDASEETAKSRNTEIPADTPVTYGYLQQFKEEIKEELRAEIIAQLSSEGAFDVKQTYEEVTLKKGQLLLLSADSEVIYRGGNAVAVTSANTVGEGITDMSAGNEIFSGRELEYGHIYYPSASESKKAILVTGETAYFTVRGNYEIG